MNEQTAVEFLFAEASRKAFEVIHDTIATFRERTGEAPKIDPAAQEFIDLGVAAAITATVTLLHEAGMITLDGAK